jgi:hypothetical protein
MIPLQLFDQPLLPRTVFPGSFPSIINFIPTCNGSDCSILTLSVDGRVLIAVDHHLNFVTLNGGTELVRGHLELIAPKALPTKVLPVIAVSRRFAAVGFPWSANFRIVLLRNGPCIPSAECELHTLPITALGISGSRLVYAGTDCCLRLWELDGTRQIRFLAVHSQPMILLKVSGRLKAAIAIAYDGFLIAMSIIDAKYLGGVNLGISNPTHLIVSRSGYIAVCFNGPDSHEIVVVDQNLLMIEKKSFDGCVNSWVTAERGGLDYLFLALSCKRLVIRKLPFVEEELKELEISFVPSHMEFVRKESQFYAADGIGNLYTFKME